MTSYKLISLDETVAFPGMPVTLSVDTTAAGTGLRQGDPVSVVLSGHSGGQLRNGLVVPTRVGERVSLSLPRGSYSLTALGGRRETLFTNRDPYTALGGNNLVLDGQRQLYLPLSARTSTASPLVRYRTPGTFRCGTCRQQFRTYQSRRDHERNLHWTTWAFIQDFFGNR